MISLFSEERKYDFLSIWQPVGSYISVFGLIIYTIAKTIGYKLSGFETIAAFLIGWLIGLIYDYLRILITGKKE